jgi:hypothetical protein
VTIEYVVAGGLLLSLGAVRLFLDEAWKRPDRSGMLGYLGVAFGGVLVVAGLLSP